MADPSDTVDVAWDDALLAAACLAVDPIGLGGIRVRAAAGPVRDAWNAGWRTLLDDGCPVRSVPLHVDDGRLLGGLDLAASLRSGRPVHQPGLLAQVDGGYAVLSMAERIEASTAARIAAVVETGEVGLGMRTRFGVIAYDEGDEGEGLAATLIERLALCIDLRGVSVRHVAEVGAIESRASIDTARGRLPSVEIDDECVSALCGTAVALGIGSMRMPVFAIRVARTIAALAGHAVVDGGDAALAARLVYASRARQLPAGPPPDDQATDAGDDESKDRDDQEPAPDGGSPDEPPPDALPPDAPDAGDAVDRPDQALDESVLEATVAAIPAGLLKQLAERAALDRSGAPRGSGAGALGRSRQRGAPAGIRRGRPRPPERLSLIETLRAAAPWQRIRRAESADDRSGTIKVHVRAEDLHVVRFKQRHPTTTVFVVDASGSSALHRLAEAKGAVELLLADCYVRRDSVAVLAFRGKDTQLLLPPTRSLVRARRSLAGLPGGGGTPLASALDATRDLVVTLRRRGDTALAVLLTDGRGNVARDGSGGRQKAEFDALASARALRALDVNVLLIDTSPQPYPQAARLAETMGALYRPLPYAGANEMSKIVNQAARDQGRGRAA